MIQQDHAKLENVFVQSVDASWLQDHETQLDVLRLDVIHPVISGNKWFKLKYSLEDALEKRLTRVVTCGGAYSNHIAATAWACQLHNLSSTGIIRGEQPAFFSPTLLMAQECGMQLQFVSRETFRNKAALSRLVPGGYWINEGGYGEKGMRGATEILQLVTNLHDYSHLACAVGTGTTLAGLVQGAFPAQEVIGISVMKGNEALSQQVSNLLPGGIHHAKFTILHDYHFGGYAKSSPELLDFMNDLWKMHHLPTDFVYTAKLMYAIREMVTKRQIKPGSKILMIHTGGLQGNLSLSPGRLLF